VRSDPALSSLENMKFSMKERLSHDFEKIWAKKNLAEAREKP
jgi:hypothetical protein